MLKQEIYDIVISGAGPAGLSSAIFSARKGKRVLVIEKGANIGPEPRGETLHDDRVLSELFGYGVMESIALTKTAGREFHAPDTDKVIKLTRKSPSIVFRWEEWINLFEEIINGLKIELRLNSEVTDLIIEHDFVKGVVYRDKAGKERRAFGRAVFGCDGHSSIIRHRLIPGYYRQNFPIIKCLMENGNFRTGGFKYWFVPAGNLDFARDFPPLIIFLFPGNGHNFETGILIQADNAEELGIAMPSHEEIMKVWTQIKDGYPVFSEMLKGGKIYYEKLTGIPMTGTVNNFIPVKGVILIGDSAGFVEVSGGSGLVPSIKAAKIWSEIICNALDSSDKPEELWSEPNLREFRRRFNKSEINRHIVKVAKGYNFFRRLMFVKWRTGENIMKKWWIVKLLMKLS